MNLVNQFYWYIFLQIFSCSIHFSFYFFFLPFLCRLELLDALSIIFLTRKVFPSAHWSIWYGSYIISTMHFAFVDTQRSLLEWSCCWGFTNYSSLSEFMSSLSLVSWLLVLLCCLFYYFLLFIIMNNLYFSFFFSLIIVFWLPIQKKKKNKCWLHMIFYFIFWW